MKTKLMLVALVLLMLIGISNAQWNYPQVEGPYPVMQSSYPGYSPASYYSYYYPYSGDQSYYGYYGGQFYYPSGYGYSGGYGYYESGYGYPY